MKRCPDCGETKAFDEFPRNKRTKDGCAAYCKPCHNARGKESKERLYGGTRHYHLMARYGIGADDVERMIAEQGGACPVCGSDKPEHVDHSHETGQVRAILCFNCNSGLGQFRDAADTLRSAASYLERYEPEARGLTEVARARAQALALS